MYDHALSLLQAKSKTATCWKLTWGEVCWRNSVYKRRSIPHLINSSFSDASESYSFNNMNKVSYTFAKQPDEIQFEFSLKYFFVLYTNYCIQKINLKEGTYRRRQGKGKTRSLSRAVFTSYFITAICGKRVRGFGCWWVSNEVYKDGLFLLWFWLFNLLKFL